MGAEGRSREERRAERTGLMCCAIWSVEGDVSLFKFEKAPLASFLGFSSDG